MRGGFLRAFSGPISLPVGFAYLRRAISFFRCRIQVRARRSKRLDIMQTLAHDENGDPIDVPSGATGWRVKRHSGHKGRPGVIFDAEGRPLVVPLDATLADLRAQGCGPGPYRLEVVDGSRKAMGPMGYTEIPEVEDGTATPGAAPSVERAAVDSLAHAVETMQRAQAEMFARLIERVAPPQMAPAQDLRDALRHMTELHQAVRKMAGNESVPTAAPTAAPTAVPPQAAGVTPFPAASEDWQGEATKQAVQWGVNCGLPMLSRFLWSLLGLSDQQKTELGQAMYTPPTAKAAPAPAPASPSAPTTAPGGASPPSGTPPPSADAVAESARSAAATGPAPASPPPPSADPEDYAKMVAIAEQLNPAEQAAAEAFLTERPEEVAPARAKMLKMSAVDGAAYMRLLLATRKKNGAPADNPPPGGSA